MAIIDAERYSANTGNSFTGANLTAIRSICAAVSAAIIRILKPYYPEPITITDQILDAPPSLDLILPILPVRSITSVYHNAEANGLVTNFDSLDLIDNTDNQEYYLLIDDEVNGWSRSGIVRRMGTVWGSARITLPDRLAATLIPERGSLKVSYTAGPTALPAEIEYAATLMVSMIYGRRTTGIPTQSESWNGESVGYAGQFLMASAIHSPDVQALLMPYLPGLRVA